jgi:LysM repeat protein
LSSTARGRSPCPGETLYPIATAYKTTVAALKRNNGNLATLRPGMILVVQPSR